MHPPDRGVGTSLYQDLRAIVLGEVGSREEVAADEHILADSHLLHYLQKREGDGQADYWIYAGVLRHLAFLSRASSRTSASRSASPGCTGSVRFLRETSRRR